MDRCMDRRRMPVVTVLATACALVGTAPPLNGQTDAWVEARHEMVRSQIASDRGGRTPVTDPEVLRAMRAVPRHLFVPANQTRRAYADSPLPIGYGQTISQPYIVGLMTELLGVEADDVVLEIGTGSGYQAAVLAEIVDSVYTIEIVSELATAARTRLADLDYSGVVVRAGDGYYGWPGRGPFDAIVVTAAASHIPPPLEEQLAPGGRMVIPVGPPLRVQSLMLIEKLPDGSITRRNLLPVRFVPLTRTD